MNEDRNDTNATATEAPATPIKKLKGFAAMTPERQREIARMGQAALKASGKRHTWNSETAREAAKKARVGWARQDKKD